MGKFFDKRDKSPTRCENFSENDKIYGKLLLSCHYYSIFNYDTDNYCQFQDLLYSLTTSIIYIMQFPLTTTDRFIFHWQLPFFVAFTDVNRNNIGTGTRRDRKTRGKETQIGDLTCMTTAKKTGNLQGWSQRYLTKSRHTGSKFVSPRGWPLRPNAPMCTHPHPFAPAYTHLYRVVLVLWLGGVRLLCGFLGLWERVDMCGGDYVWGTGTFCPEGLVCCYCCYCCCYRPRTNPNDKWMIQVWMQHTHTGG